MRRLLIVVAVISIGVWFWVNKPAKTEVKEPNEKSEVNLLEENLPKETPKSEKVFEYTTEVDNKKIKFDIGKLNFDFSSTGIDDGTKLVVKFGNKTIFSKKYLDTVLNISKIFFNDKIILIVNYYSGGAHCCSTATPYLIDGEKVTEGKSLDLGNIDIFSADSFFIKDDKLMTLSTDDRFAYYEMDYADSGSMFFPSFYEFSLDSLEFINRDELFTDLYAKYYLKSQEEAKTMVTAENCAKDEVGKYPIFGSLVLRYTFGLLAGVDREKLKSELSNDWWCFKEKDLNNIEDSIYQKIVGTSTEDFQSDTVKKAWEKFK